MPSTTIPKIIAHGKEIPFCHSPMMTFTEFKKWLLVPSVCFSRVSVYGKPPSKKIIYLGDDLWLGGCVVNADVMACILDAYNELPSEKRIKDSSHLHFEKFTVRTGLLTKKQFQSLVKLGVNQFEDVDILDHSPQPFFNSLALHCGERAKVVNGILEIPDRVVLTNNEWNLLQTSSISFHVGKRVSVRDSKPPESVNLCNVIFNKSEAEGVDLSGGFIFNDNTDFTKWSGCVTIPDDAPIIYVNKANIKIHMTAAGLYDELKKRYYELRGGIGFFSRFKTDYIRDVIEKDGLIKKTKGEKLFKLLQHMQEQKSFLFFSSHRTLDAFRDVMRARVATIGFSGKQQSARTSVLSSSEQSQVYDMK